MPPDAAYTIADLARLTGLNVRTIRYYLAQGLLPASGESGPGAHYGEGHLDRLRLTKRLQAQHLPLAEIRTQLAELTDDQVASVLAAPTVEDRDARQTSALEYVRGLLGQGSAVAEERAAYVLPVATPPPAVATGRAPARMLASFIARPAAMPRMRDAPATRLTESASIPATPASAPIEPPPSAPPPTEPQSFERSQWERLSLGPNVELHIRRPLSRLEQRRVERLITIARQVLHEDQS